MFFWSIKVIILSIVFIFVVHNIIHYFKTNLTAPKTKDYVFAPIKKYDEIFDVLKKEEVKEKEVIKEENSMKRDLMEFMQSHIR
jgi:hypothetical protein